MLVTERSTASGRDWGLLPFVNPLGVPSPSGKWEPLLFSTASARRQLWSVSVFHRDRTKKAIKLTKSRI